MKNHCLWALPILFLLLAAPSCNSGYTDYQKTEGVSFGYKWAEVNNDAGERVPALMLMVDNENTCAIQYSLSVDFYYEGILRETGELSHCVPPRKTRKGKLNGVYLVSEQFSAEQIDGGDFKLELNDIEVDPIEVCEE